MREDRPLRLAGRAARVELERGVRRRDPRQVARRVRAQLARRQETPRAGDARRADPRDRPTRRGCRPRRRRRSTRSPPPGGAARGRPRNPPRGSRRRTPRPTLPPATRGSRHASPRATARPRGALRRRGASAPPDREYRCAPSSSTIALPPSRASAVKRVSSGEGRSMSGPIALHRAPLHPLPKSGEAGVGAL